MKKFLALPLIILFPLFFLNPPTFSSHEKAENKVKEFVGSIRVNEPVSYKNLTLFPLSMEKVKGEGSVLTLDEAIKSGYLKIYEKWRAEVNSVLVENLSRFYIFLMSGELLTGCKQDRMVAYDTLVPPYSGRMSLTVFCTERGRWYHKSASFESLPLSASPGLRKVAVETESQKRVWDVVSMKREELKSAPSETEAFQDIVKDKKVENKLRDYIENIEKKFPFSEKVTGVVVAIGDEIVCMDVFYHPKTFKKLWRKLIQGYGLDSIGKEENSKELPAKRIEAFISDILEANFSSGETDGEGEALKIESEKVRGTALIFKNFVIHLQAFPKGSL